MYLLPSLKCLLTNAIWCVYTGGLYSVVGKILSVLEDLDRYVFDKAWHHFGPVEFLPKLTNLVYSVFGINE